MRSRSSTANIERMVRLEAHVSTLGSTIDRMVASVDQVSRESAASVERVARDAASNMHAAVTELSASIRTVDSKVDHVVERIGAKLDERSRTPWSTLAAWAGVMVVVLGALGSSWVRPIEVQAQALEKRVERLEELSSRRDRPIAVAQRGRRDRP